MTMRLAVLIFTLVTCSAVHLWPQASPSAESAQDLAHWPSVEAKAAHADDRARLEDTALCSVGMFYHRGPSGVPRCTKCPAGKYSTTTDAVACTECEEGRYQLREGQVSCNENRCPAGTFKSDVPGYERGAGCIECAPGKISAAGAMQCELCPKGQYNDKTGAVLADCVASNCPKGKFQNTDPAACTTCGQHQYTDEVGLSKCKYCKDGLVGRNHKECRRHVAIGQYKKCSHTECIVDDMPEGLRHKVNVHLLGEQATQRFRVMHKGTSHDQSNWENGIHHRCHYSKELNKCMCVCWNPQYETKEEAEQPKKECLCTADFNPVKCSNNRIYTNLCKANCAGAQGCEATIAMHV